MNKGNEPAYPISKDIQDQMSNGHWKGLDKYSQPLGLTKREYFACLNLQGILANRELQKALYADLQEDSRGNRVIFPKNITKNNILAYEALRQADELLKQLES